MEPPDDLRQGRARRCTGSPGHNEMSNLEQLVRADYERCHPDDTFDDLKRRAQFTKEDRGLLREWM